MSYLGARNAISLGVSYQATLGGPNLLNKLSPSLLLNFTNTSTLDPRITFTRSTTATFTGSNGLIQTAAINAPRFDYNPTTLASLGLLIEEQRVNLLLYSEEFDNAAWSSQAVSRSANSSTAPDGTTTADTVTETTANSAHRIDQTVSTSGTVTLSVFAKLGSGTRFLTIGVSRDATINSSATFNLSLGTNTQTQVNGGIYASPSATITAVAQGFYRCTFTVTTDTATLVRIGLNNTGTPSSGNRGFGAGYTGDGTSSLILWGAQLEAGAFATSYIPTVASQVTRAADIAVMTGTNFSDWYNATEGTLFANYSAFASGTRTMAAINDNTANESIRLRTVSTNPFFTVTDGGVDQADIDAGTVASNIVYKFAGAYAANDFAASIAGGAAITDTSGSIPTVDRMMIGNSAAINALNGHISQIVYYPRRLANAELQGIAS